MSKPPLRRRKNTSYSNRGMELEKLIDMTNKQYENAGVGIIKKLPTPVHIYSTFNGRVSGALKKGELVDYIGMSQGKALAFDAKQTRGKSLPLKNIPSHQYKYLKEWHNNGGVSFLIIYFRDYNEVYYYPFDRIQYWQEGQTKRKSIPYDDVREYGELLQASQKYTLDYLKAVHDKWLYF